jgi:hypothetical protein
MYILIDKNTNKVAFIRDKKPISYTDNLILAEVEMLPEKYDYLIAENIKEVTDKWIETVEDYDDNGEIVSKEVENSRTYLTCDLKACFNPAPTYEQLEALKEKRIDERAKMLIRQKYELEDEFKIQRRIVAYPDNAQYKLDFLEYNEYVEKCILKAREEIYK